MEVILYTLVIGSLKYATLCTRLDITYAISVTSRFQVNLGSEHQNVFNCVLKYLRGTKDMVLVHGERDLRVDGYTDSDFPLGKHDRMLISTFILTVYGGVICWKSSQHSITIDSITKVEYIVVCDVVNEAIQIRKLVIELQLVLMWIN